MFAPGLLANKSTANTAAMVAGNPFFGAASLALDALGGGPSAAYGAPANSGGNPINLGAVNIGSGSAKTENKATGSSNPNIPNPLNPLDFGSPLGVAGYGPSIPQPGGPAATLSAGVSGSALSLPILAALGVGAYFLVKRIK